MSPPLSSNCASKKKPNPPTQPFNPYDLKRQVTQVLRRISPLPSSQVVHQQVVAWEHLLEHGPKQLQPMRKLFRMTE